MITTPFISLMYLTVQNAVSDQKTVITADSWTVAHAYLCQSPLQKMSDHISNTTIMFVDEPGAYALTVIMTLFFGI